jgi:membrane protease subunit HflC
VVSGERDALMADITRSLNTMAEKELGIEVVDVRVKAIDLPKEVNRSVFERMSTEREREAREHRAKGNELAEGIRADATVSVAYCWPRPIASLKRRVVTVMRKPRRSTPKPTARTRSSTRSTVACVPTVKALRTKPTSWCWTRAATSSATWKSPSNSLFTPVGRLKRLAG